MEKSKGKFEISDEALDELYKILGPIAVRILKEERENENEDA